MGISLTYGSDLETTESSKLFKYSVPNYSDLSTLSDVQVDDLAYVKNTTGSFNPFTTTRLKGLYSYDGTNWVYSSEDLQNEVASNISEIESNDTDILNLQNNKLDKGSYNGTAEDLEVQIDINKQTNLSQALEDARLEAFKLDKGGYTGTAQDLEDRIITLEDIENSLGTIQFVDTQYTTTNRIVGSPNIDLVIPNNKGNIFNVSAPSIASDWFLNNKIQPENGNGDTWVTRLDFSYRVTQQNRNASLSIDIGGSQGKIFDKKFTLGRVANQDSPMSILLNYYTAQTFFDNGGELKLNVNGAFEIWDIKIVITKIKKAISGGVTPPTSFGMAQFIVTQEFIGGFNFNLVIENNSVNAVNGWLVTLENTNIASISQTNTTVNQIGNDWQLGNLSFNGTINAGQTLTINGLQGTTGDPSNINSPIVQNILLEEV